MVKPPLRTKSIGFKVSQEEYAQLETAAQASRQTLGEWCREMILRGGASNAAAPDPALAEIIGVRLLLVNVLGPVAAGEKVTPEKFNQLRRSQFPRTGVEWCWPALFSDFRGFLDWQTDTAGGRYCVRTDNWCYYIGRHWQPGDGGAHVCAWVCPRLCRVGRKHRSKVPGGCRMGILKLQTGQSAGETSGRRFSQSKQND